MRSTTLMCATGALLALSSSALAQTINEDQSVYSPLPVANDQFGSSVDIDGNLMATGAQVADVFATNEGRAYLHTKDANGDWVLVQELIPTTVLDIEDRFGFSIAIDNGRVAVGAVLDDEAAFSNSGAVYIFEETSPGSWSETAQLLSTTPFNEGQFGYSVDLDGDRLIVGSRGDDQFRGAAFIFEYDQVAMTWNLMEKITANDAEINDRFGESVAIQGDRAVVGADADAHSGFTLAGSAYAFQYLPASSDWRLADKMISPTPGATDQLGFSVAIEGDDVYVGAPVEDSLTPVTPNSGAVFVYRRTNPLNYDFVTTIEPPTPRPFGQFGASIAVEGNRIIIGANGEDGDADNLTTTGAVYYFEREPGDVFTEVFRLAGSDAVDDGLNDFYGSDVAISGDSIAATYPTATEPSSSTPGAGAVTTFTIGTLYHGDPTISVSSGGEQQFFVRAGTAVANQPYIILGSGSGTSPGTLDAASGITIPLVFDSYFLTILNGAGAGLVGPWFGFLDANGNADAKFGIPAGSSPSLAGTQLWHGFITIDVFVTGLLSSATNAVKVTLVP